MDTFRYKSLFNDRVDALITNKNFGAVHPKREDFLNQLKRLKMLSNSDEILFPSLDFTNEIVEAESGKKAQVETLSSASDERLKGFLRSKFNADAAISSSFPIAICNGDCPVGIAISTADENGESKLLFMHLGLMSMISKTGRSSLIKESVSRLRSKGLEIDAFWMGFGAQSCCYGIWKEDDKWSFIKRWQEQDLVVSKGPRKGQKAIDLGEIAKNQLLELDISNEKIEIDSYCTVCGGKQPEEGPHFSNLMRHGNMARNAAIAWLK